MRAHYEYEFAAEHAAPNTIKVQGHFHFTTDLHIYAIDRKVEIFEQHAACQGDGMVTFRTLAVVAQPDVRVRVLPAILPTYLCVFSRSIATHPVACRGAVYKLDIDKNILLIVLT